MLGAKLPNFEVITLKLGVFIKLSGKISKKFKKLRGPIFFFKFSRKLVIFGTKWTPV